MITRPFRTPLAALAGLCPFAINVSYALCAKRAPTMLTATGNGRWAVDYLALVEPGGPPAPQETAAAVYYAVCHASAAPDPDAFVRLARRFGYPTADEGPEVAPLA